jgi:nucleotide-binding universal stress UspA family protein
LLIKRILTAIDGSKPSLKASTFAIDLANKFDAELIVLHVIDPRYKELEIAISPRPGKFKEIATRVIENGEKIVETVRQKATEKNVNVKTDVISDFASVTQDILEYAKVNKVDIIVVGSRGITGFKKLLVGSVASGVVTYANCPVVVVK